MNTTFTIVAAISLLLVIGGILAVVFARRRHMQRLQQHFGPEYDHIVHTVGDEKQALNELDERQKHVAALDIRSLSADERDRYLDDWTAVQTKFVDEPGQAIVDADRLIVEVMVLRNYPVSDFEQRAADISVNYPDLVTDYRAARTIADKNARHQANTEELRQAMINYRSLFEQMLELEPALS